MLDALYIGATGMQAQQTNLDTIANNLANANTQGYKKGRVSFADLVTSEASRLPQAAQVDAFSPALHLGGGVGISSVQKLFDMGELKKTESGLDIAIQGDGFLEVSMPDGTTAYSRGGTLSINKDGQLANQAGYPLKPGISVPDNVQNLIIGADGRVQFKLNGQVSLAEGGRLELVRFVNSGQLSAQGDNLYRATEAAGAPISSSPGENGIGSVAQGYLEMSNVKMLEEMVNLMIAQRTYEANVKIVQASDEILGMVNNLRK